MAESKLKIPTKIAVIDSDESSANMTLKFLMAAGVEETQFFHNADEAIQAIYEGKFSGAIVDWKIKGLSALAFIARLRRSIGYDSFPIVITSGLIKKREFKILSEYLCVQLIEKPFAQSEMEKALSFVETEKSWYENSEREILKIIKQNGKKPDKLFQAAEKLVAKAPNPNGAWMEMTRELVTQGFLETAEAVIKKILEKDRENLTALQALATIKSLHGKNEEALDILERAHKICPDNIDRLSLLGEIEISLSNPEDAITYFHKALEIDPEHAKAKVGLAVATTMEEGASNKLFAGTPSVARILNNLGIVLAKKGAIDKALKYYFMSLSFLADQALQAKVSFNIGLGYTRGKKLENARKWLDKALTLSEGKMDKARSVLELIDATMGNKFNMKNAEIVPDKKGSDEKLISKLDESLDPKQQKEFEEESLRKIKANPSENSEEEKQTLQTLINEIDKIEMETDESLEEAS